MMPSIGYDCEDLQVEVEYLDVVTFREDWPTGWPYLWFDEKFEATVSTDDLPGKMSADGSAMFWSIKIWGSYYRVRF